MDLLQVLKVLEDAGIEFLTRESYLLNAEEVASYVADPEAWIASEKALAAA